MKLSLPVVQHPRTCGANSRKQGMAAAHRVILGILAEADSPLETHSAPGTFSDFQKNKRDSGKPKCLLKMRNQNCLSGYPQIFEVR